MLWEISHVEKTEEGNSDEATFQSGEWQVLNSGRAVLLVGTAIRVGYMLVLEYMG
jgi:hypothetical protein